MGWCMGVAWHGAWGACGVWSLHHVVWIGEVGLVGLGAVWMVTVWSWLVGYHAWPSLTVNQNPNPTPPSQGVSALNDTAADILTKISTQSKLIANLNMNFYIYYVIEFFFI